MTTEPPKPDPSLSSDQFEPTFEDTERETQPGFPAPPPPSSHGPGSFPPIPDSTDLPWGGAGEVAPEPVLASSEGGRGRPTAPRIAPASVSLGPRSPTSGGSAALRRSRTPRSSVTAPAPVRSGAGGFFRDLFGEGGWPTVRKVLLVLLGAGVGAAVLGAGAVAIVIHQLSKDLPDEKRLTESYHPAQVTRIVASDGTLLDELFLERRTVVPFERIPDHLKSAVLAAEDAGFYEHEGLDYLGLLRAIYVNLRAGHLRQGGSTITQQVVKNVLLDSERSYRRKIRESVLAYRIEKHLTKEQILGVYLNHIYLGHGRYGVEEASRFYFGKHVEEVNVAEAATLAGIIASPENYSPEKHPERALGRRKFVLDQMLRKGFMTTEVHAAYEKSPLRLAPSAEKESDIAPELTPRVRALLERAAPEAALRGGFTVETTIVPELQVAARKALRKGLDDYLARQKIQAPLTLKERRAWGKLHQGAVKQHGIYVGQVTLLDDAKGTLDVKVGDVTGRIDLAREERFNPTHLLPSAFAAVGAALRVRVLDPPSQASADEPVRLGLELGPQAALVALSATTGEVLAVVGGYEALAGGLDRSVQAKRQPGSTFKPFYYAEALARGDVTAATVFEFPVKNPQPVAAGGPPAPAFERLTVRRGLAKSDNRVALEVFRRVGVERVSTFTPNFGFTSKLGADESLALGSYEVSPWELAGAFGTFASGGIYREPRLFRSVTSGRGAVELPARAAERRVLESNVAYLITNLLEGVVQEGTATAARALGRPLAGKTGTTNQVKDAWFAGYSADVVAVVWVGYDDAKPLGPSESGARTALPIWLEFMKAAHAGKPAVGFPRPPGIVERSIDPNTGYLAGYGAEGAVTELFIEGTEPTTSEAPLEPSSEEAPPGEPASEATEADGAPELPEQGAPTPGEPAESVSNQPSVEQEDASPGAPPEPLPTEPAPM